MNTDKLMRWNSTRLQMWAEKLLVKIQSHINHKLQGITCFHFVMEYTTNSLIKGKLGQKHVFTKKPIIFCIQYKKLKCTVLWSGTEHKLIIQFCINNNNNSVPSSWFQLTLILSRVFLGTEYSKVADLMVVPWDCTPSPGYKDWFFSHEPQLNSWPVAWQLREQPILELIKVFIPLD